MRHGGGLLRLLRRTAKARCRRADLGRYLSPGGRAAAQKTPVFDRPGPGRIERCRSRQTCAPFIGPGACAAADKRAPFSSRRGLVPQQTNAHPFHRAGGLCRSRQTRVPFVRPGLQRRILHKLRPCTEPLCVNEACRQALVRQHVSVQKAEAAFPIRLPPGGGLRPAHRPGQLLGRCLGPLFVPKCRTPRANPAAGKLPLA